MRRWVLILVPFLALSCHRPASTEAFIRGDGPYRFTVDMSDSTARYDFDLYTRIDAKAYPAEVRLEMMWKDPADSVFRETVYLPVSDEWEDYFTGEPVGNGKIRVKTAGIPVYRRKK